MLGKAIIFSAPSGAGKTTIVKRLLKEIPSFAFSTSATTRPIRAGELDGRDYHFLTVKQFLAKKEAQELLEWEEVYEDTFYGTLKSEVEKIWSNNQQVIFDVDVKGGLKLKRIFQDRAVSIFVKVPTVELLHERLSKRNTEDQESLKMRIRKAVLEMEEEPRFDFTVENLDLEDAVAQAKEIVLHFIKN
ncbi:MAG: guanylate kinase [Bacteroidota bacterium]